MKLATYLQKYRIRRVDFAKAIGRAPSTVTRLASGSVPDKETMARIEKVTEGKVRPNDFFERVAA